jgi:hypothetical protein
MNGMQAKKIKRAHSARFTADGLPRDANAWTYDDWRDLWHAMQTVIVKVSKRHAKDADQTESRDANLQPQVHGDASR